MKIPMARHVHAENGVRYLAFRIPPNGCYVEKTVIVATPDETDENPKLIGSVVLNSFAYPNGFPRNVEWIEVDEEYRRRGIGKKLFDLAEKIVDDKVEHNPVTPLGELFAKSFE